MTSFMLGNFGLCSIGPDDHAVVGDPAEQPGQRPAHANKRPVYAGQRHDTGLQLSTIKKN